MTATAENRPRFTILIESLFCLDNGEYFKVIAVCYLLQAVGAQANSSEQARFIEFLINKTPKEIYKRVLAINSTVYNLDGQDASYVRDWFNKLGLNNLAKKIDEILGQSREPF